MKNEEFEAAQDSPRKERGRGRTFGGDDIDAVHRNELGHLALGNYLVALTPVEQSAQPVEHIVLGWRAALGGKGILVVTGETAREVFTYVAVGDFLGAVHQDLGAVIQLRNALDGE